MFNNINAIKFSLIFFFSLMTTKVFADSFVMEDYFPLELNPTFTYQLNGGALTETINVQSGTFLVGGIATKRVDYLSDGTQEFYTNDGNGLRFHRTTGVVSGIGTLDSIFNPALIRANAVMETGESISDSTIATSTLTGFGTFPLTFTSSIQINGLEQVTVPAGTFTALKVTETLSLSGTISGIPVSDSSSTASWLVKHLGVVKTQDIVPLGGDMSELISVDSDGDGVINSIDTDDDGDGVLDIDDAFPLDPDRSQEPVNISMMPFIFLLTLFSILLIIGIRNPLSKA